MSIDKKYIKSFSQITSKAAISASKFIGLKDKIAADKAAVDTMRNELNKLDVDGKIVIGEGELDEAPMLYIGENIGTGKGSKIDIAVDPIEGTNFVAKNLPGGLSVLAIAKKDSLIGAPETYMYKIAYGNEIPKDVLDIDFSIEKNINNLSNILKKKIQDIRVCILDRPRHKQIIEKLIKLKVKTKLITDGDVSGALLVTEKKHNVDLFLGIGGGPEGVLAACALNAYNCNFQGRFLFESEEDKNRAKLMGINDFNKKYYINEIVKGDSIFCATGITDGDLVKGVKLIDNEYSTETLVTHTGSNTKEILTTKHQITT